MVGPDRGSVGLVRTKIRTSVAAVRRGRHRAPARVAPGWSTAERREAPGKPAAGGDVAPPGPGGCRGSAVARVHDVPLSGPPHPEGSTTTVSAHSYGRGAMTIAMSEQVDAEPCDVLRGGDGPVYFLLGGRLYVVHEILGRWIEPDVEPRRRGRHAAPQDQLEGEQLQGLGRVPAQEQGAAGCGLRDAAPMPPRQRESAESDQAGRDQTERDQDAPEPEQPAQVEHWLVIASIGRFGTPAVFRLQRRPAPPANGPDRWTVRAERR